LLSFIPPNGTWTGRFGARWRLPPFVSRQEGSSASAKSNLIYSHEYFSIYFLSSVSIYKVSFDFTLHFIVGDLRSSMGQQPSIPKDLTKEVRVIGAGFSRTGTVSFAIALEKLLEGPVCHGGTTLLLREEGLPPISLPLSSTLVYYPTCQHVISIHSSMDQNPGS